MNVKKRYWAFVLYPESAPADWLDIIQMTGLPFAVSPLHDKDLNADNSIKKSHYHIILCYPGPTTYNNVKSFTDGLNQPIPQPLDSVKGYYRYFTHKDNPEKFQYNECDISCYNGFDSNEFNSPTSTEINSILKYLISFIDDNDIIEYSTLIDILNNCDELLPYFDVASHHTLFLNTYLSSRRNSVKKICK